MEQKRHVRKELVEAWRRFVNHTDTMEDLVLLLNSVKENDGFQEFDEISDSVWEEAMAKKPLMTEERKEAYRERACQLLNEYKRKRIIRIPTRKSVRLRKVFYAAASIALLVASSISIKLLYDNRPAQEVEAIIVQAMPSNEIHLISGEKVVDLKQNAQIALNEGRISVVDDSHVSEIALSENIMHKLVVPSGKRSTLQLADGTHIWLNSGTELDFPSEFTGDIREISVKGEIYIEVAKGQKPFYVNTSQFKVQVFGTKFNISAYGENEESSVVLVEGSVEVVSAGKEPARLSPNEKATVNAGEILKETVNVEEYTGWKDGVLIFNRTPISEVLKKIGRYYNVRFENHFDDKLSAEIITGELILIEDFDELMVSLSDFFSLQYHRDGDIIYLKKK